MATQRVGKLGVVHYFLVCRQASHFQRNFWCPNFREGAQLFRIGREWGWLLKLMGRKFWNYYLVRILRCSSLVIGLIPSFGGDAKRWWGLGRGRFKHNLYMSNVEKHLTWAHIIKVVSKANQVVPIFKYLGFLKVVRGEKNLRIIPVLDTKNET